MDRGAKGLILGIAIGAVATLLALRIREVRSEDDPEELLDRVQEQIEVIERNFQRLKEGV